MTWPIQKLRENLVSSNKELLALLAEYERKINYLESRLIVVEGFMIKALPFVDTMMLLQPRPNSEREAP